MQVKAKLSNLRIAPRKVRLVVDLIRGLKAQEAVEQLSFLNKRAARPILKLLNSAIANAENNFKLEKDNLYIKTITVDNGRTLKRWLPRAHGRATMLRKRSSHVKIVLAEIKPTSKKADLIQPEKAVKPEKTSIDKGKASAKQEKPAGKSKTADSRNKGKHQHKQPAGKQPIKKKGFIKNVFQRKAD